MTIETCPFCGAKFDGRKHHYSDEEPFVRPDFFEAADAQFRVRCPSCGEAYVSDSVKFLGIATRKYYFLFLLLLVLAVVVFVSVFASKANA